MFVMIMGDLKKAKQTLDSEQQKVVLILRMQLKLQQNNYDRIDQKQEEASKEIREKQRVELEVTFSNASKNELWSSKESGPSKQNCSKSIKMC